MPSENELVEKMVTTHTSPSIAELVNMKFLSLWIQDIADPILRWHRENVRGFTSSPT